VRVGELGREVTGLEVVGATLPKLGAHDGHGDAHGRRRGSAADHCGVGSCEVVGRTAHAHWGLAGGGGVEENRGRGFGRAMASGSSFPLVSN
jgi:hypothetical protein